MGNLLLCFLDYDDTRLEDYWDYDYDVPSSYYTELNSPTTAVQNQCEDTINGFLGTDNNCYCNEGYSWSLTSNKCIKDKTPTEICRDTYGIYFLSSGEKNSNGTYNCSCETGYTFGPEG